MAQSPIGLFTTVVCIGALAISSGNAQQIPARAPDKLAEGVTAVLVDVVVRDARGQPVRDLSAGDFVILEDGVPQSVGSFTAVFDNGAGTADATGVRPPAAAGESVGVTAPSSAGSTGPSVMAMVFDRLTPEGRQLAVQAAESYLGTKEETQNYIGIFGIDLSLTPYVPFTRNAVALRQALERMSTRGSPLLQGPERQPADADREALVQSQAAASAPAGGPGAAVGPPGDPAAAQVALMHLRMIQGFEDISRDQQGYSTTNGLVAIINTLARIPGRKSLVLFSEGIAIPTAVQRFYLGVIDAANRANVSIYALDAAGLRAESDQAKIGNRVNQMARRGINTGYSGGGGGGALTADLERNEDVLRQDPNTGLRGLAEDTGGLMFNNTNNLRQSFARIDNDLRNYYLLGYTPLTARFDGRFRTIEVKVNRPGVTVAARKGYFAVRDAGGMPVNAWEAPALGALEQRPVPNAFPVRAGSLLFPERGRPGLIPVIVHFPTAPLTFQPAADGKTYSSDFTVLVRFVDHQNQVARKVSQHYEVNGPVANLEDAKRGEIIFYRESELPPGVYSMETIVYDAPSGQSSVRFSTVEVPREVEGRLRMSSLVLVRGAEKVSGQDHRPDSPLLVDDVVLYPNLGEPVSKASKEIGFYFAVYPARNDSQPASAIELLLNGRSVAQVPMPVAAADASGRIQQVGRLPLAQLAHGTYELRAMVKQGTEQVVRSTLMQIVE